MRPKALAAHKEFAAKLPNATHILVEKSGHAIQQDRPELVIEAIRKVVEAARAKSVR